MAGVKLASGGQAWFCTTGLPNDVVIEVDGMSFHLHKLPLMLKSRKLHELLTEQEPNPGERDEEEELRRISLDDFPGGSETFEAAVKFCYGVKVDFNADTAAPLRCAAEYLEMTEELHENNLITCAERFLSQSVFRSLAQSIKALKACEALLPLSEELSLPQRCIDNIVARALAAEPRDLFGWPVNDTGVRQRNGGIRFVTWLEDLSMLNLPFYKRLISAMKEGNPSSELIEGSLMSYARKYIPWLSRSNRNIAVAAPSPPSEPEQLEILETVITNLLPKSCELITVRFLFGLLRTANILQSPESLRMALERKIAAKLEQATLDDLLMPSYSYLVETLYDVQAVERILRHYIEDVPSAAIADRIVSRNGEETVAMSPAGDSEPVLRLGRLVDGYLAEVASDSNLRPEKFCDIALALPSNARLYDDGLYRAVDIYLKAHPGMTEEEKERVCGVMDYQKLTLEACMHAAQNERLPLRAVVQVLFYEQLRLRQAVAGTVLAEEEEEVVPPGERRRWRAAEEENQMLRLGMDSVRNRLQDLEREYSSMRRAIVRIDRRAQKSPTAGRWDSLGRRFGCKSTIELSDSQAAAAVTVPKGSGEQQRQ